MDRDQESFYGNHLKKNLLYLVSQGNMAMNWNPNIIVGFRIIKEPKFPPSYVFYINLINECGFEISDEII